MDEFIGELRLLKAWTGDPSITEITRRIHIAWQQAGRPRNEWPARSTVGNCFQIGRRRPNADLLLAVVHALVDGDAAAISTWRQALRAVLGEAEAAARVSVYDRLPAELPLFVGREDLLGQAAALLRTEGEDRAVVLEGMAGSGKTALAVRLSHRLAAEGLVDGPVLFADLRGCAADSPAACPAAVLESFLRLLGVAGERIPHSLDGRAALYQQLLSSTRALVFLDDAVGEEQVRPLLPRSRTCRTLITSRRALSDLNGLKRLPVPVLSPPDAVDLLCGTAGEECIEADVSALRRIVEQLGCNPLAVSIIGRHMRDHRGWGLADYYRESLTVLAMEGGVRAALAASDAQLPFGARRLLRLMALHPLHDVDVHAVAALADESVASARRHLDLLAAAHFLQRTSPGWYRLHDLAHVYAEERMSIDEPASQLRQALDRVLAHYREGATGVSPSRSHRLGAAVEPYPSKHTVAWSAIRLLARETTQSYAA